jgi:alanyl-tRNA synthetase
MMQSAEIRQQFLDFFKGKGHTILRSTAIKDKCGIPLTNF